jgi:hypothetical protein
MNSNILDLGAQDPELRNSPVAWESDDDTDALREQSPGATVCYFNDTEYDLDTIIKSGDSLLRCSYGLWVPVASSDPDNP